MKQPTESTTIDQRFKQMLTKLKEHQFRLTPQRLAVLKVLAVSEGHPTVERIHAAVRAEFPTTSIATVYKTINLLKQLDEVLELGFPDGSNRYDGNKPYPHPHVICTRCQKIIDLNLDRLKDLTKELIKETGFQIVNHRVDFFGTCRDCQSRKA
jgi:Fur family peroxide stress response transcriptional regulator